MNLLYVITTYGVLVAAAIASNFITHQWALAFIGAPLWGLLCYQWTLLALVSTRVNSIRILEQKLLCRVTALGDAEKNQIGSDAGDRISRVSKQPKFLVPANIDAFGQFRWPLAQSRSRPCSWCSPNVRGCSSSGRSFTFYSPAHSYRRSSL